MVRFRAVPVTSLEDATLDFEQLQTKDILNLTAESVLQLLTTGTVRKIQFGSSSLTFPGTALATPLVVSHGLGVVPWIVLPEQPQVASSNSTAPAVIGADVYTTTTFTMTGHTSDAGTAGPGSVTVHWVAIG